MAGASFMSVCQSVCPSLFFFPSTSIHYIKKLLITILLSKHPFFFFFSNSHLGRSPPCQRQWRTFSLCVMESYTSSSFRVWRRKRWTGCDGTAWFLEGASIRRRTNTCNKTNEISTWTYKYDMSRHKYRSVTFKKERRERERERENRKGLLLTRRLKARKE